MKHIKLFENFGSTSLINVDSLDEFKQSFSDEFKGIDWFNTTKFKTWDKFLEDGIFSSSKYLTIEGKIIGGFLIFKSNISTWYDMMLENDSVSNMKVHKDPHSLDNKNGIYLEYIFIKPKWRSKGYAKELIKSIESLGYDYMWEMSVEKVASKYWLNEIKRDVMFEYDDTDEQFGKTYVTYKEL